jgi:hypothetical protein
MHKLPWSQFLITTPCEGHIQHKLSKFCQKVPYGIL